ncbi:MAG: hypothetical protein HRT89_17055 [Lentisphaeria bacterium]|nr:hypothetical protein [Lentisphaeria bacterium]NQZ69769.1 hypothetical protein [Lentisphaeria bacterium]
MLKKIVICNPLYLVSALCILLGIYFVSIDENLLRSDLVQLLFNFSSLQIYETALILAAAFLFRKKILNDSQLLVLLDAIFIFIPFILLHGSSHLGEPGSMERVYASIVICSLGIAFIAGRHYAAGKALRLKANTVTIFTVFLLFNFCMPVIYASLNTAEADSFDKRVTLYYNILNICVPLLILLFVMHRQKPVKSDGVSEHLPLTQALVWLTISLFHLFWIAYLYDIDHLIVNFIPMLWTASWVLIALRSRLNPMLKKWVYLAPLSCAFFLLDIESRAVTQYALLLSSAGLGILVYVNKRNWMIISSLLANSLLFFLAFLFPGNCLGLETEFSQRDIIHVTLITASVACLFFRHPRLGLGGLICVCIVSLSRIPFSPDKGYYFLSIALIYLALHSMRWRLAFYKIRKFLFLAIIVYLYFLSIVVDKHSLMYINVACLWLITLGVYFFNSRSVARKTALITLCTVGLLPAEFIQMLLNEKAYGPLAILFAFVFLAVGLCVSIRQSRKKEKEDEVL